MNINIVAPYVFGGHGICQYEGVGCYCDLLTIWLPLVRMVEHDYIREEAE
jgi:hypothetical protein